MSLNTNLLKVKTGHPSVHLKHQNATENYSNLPLKWEEIPADMQSVFPHDDSYTIIIQSHTPEDTECFDGAPTFSINAIVRININEPEEVNAWLKKLMEASHCTYRVSRGGHKPSDKRILCKHEMHCQHFRKSLTSMQLQKKCCC